MLVNIKFLERYKTGIFFTPDMQKYNTRHTLTREIHVP